MKSLYKPSGAGAPRGAPATVGWGDPLNSLQRGEGLRHRPSETQWTRLQPIRTVAEIPVMFTLLTQDPFRYQEIAARAGRLRRLGMTLRAIGEALGVDEKTVRNALRRG